MPTAIPSTPSRTNPEPMTHDVKRVSSPHPRMPYPKSSVATIRLNATIIENTPMTTAPSGEYFDPRHRLLQFQAPVRVPYRTLHPSKSAYRFRQTRSAEGLSPESSNHPSLLISSISWTDDGLDSPAH